MPAPRFAGEPVLIGGTEYIVPPLGLLAVRTLLPTIEKLSLTDAGEVSDPFSHLDELLDVCFAAVSRNYPDVSRDEFAAAIDFKNFAPLVSAVMRQSGFTTVKAGSEKNAPAVVSPSVGPASTDDSPPPSAGAGSTSTST